MASFCRKQIHKNREIGGEREKESRRETEGDGERRRDIKKE